MSALIGFFRKLSGKAEFVSAGGGLRTSDDTASHQEENSRTQRKYEWEFALPWRKVQLIDGTTGDGWVMRRRAPDGSWQYRAMTEQEALDRAISEIQ
jgi:hypothetical protein